MNEMSEQEINIMQKIKDVSIALMLGEVPVNTTTVLLAKELIEAVQEFMNVKRLEDLNGIEPAFLNTGLNKGLMSYPSDTLLDMTPEEIAILKNSIANEVQNPTAVVPQRAVGLSENMKAAWAARIDKEKADKEAADVPLTPEEEATLKLLLGEEYIGDAISSASTEGASKLTHALIKDNLSGSNIHIDNTDANGNPIVITTNQEGSK